MNYRDESVSYLKNKAVTDVNKAKMSLSILLNHPAGIGDHSTGDLYANLDEALDMLVDAEDRLSILEKYKMFMDYTPV